MQNGKRIQNTVLQALTDAINLMLLDKGLITYINKFELKMVPPTTQEEIDRRDNMSSKIQIISDIMNLLSDVEDTPTKLRILQSMLSSVVSENDVIQTLNDYIESIELESANEESTESEDEDIDIQEETEVSPPVRSSVTDLDMSSSSDDSLEREVTQDEASTTGEETILPNPSEFEMDLTDNTLEI